VRQRMKKTLEIADVHDYAVKLRTPERLGELIDEVIGSGNLVFSQSDVRSARWQIFRRCIPGKAHLRQKTHGHEIRVRPRRTYSIPWRWIRPGCIAEYRSRV